MSRDVNAPMPDLSVVVLCYRAGERAYLVVDALNGALDRGGIASRELVLVSNYRAGDESDPTPSVVHALAERDPRVVVSAVPKQGMMGWDMRTGLALASGRVVAVIDGDGQIDPFDVVRGYRLIVAGDYDLVHARRRTRGDGPARWVLSRGFNTLFRLLFPRTPSGDVNGKPKLFRRDALARLDLRSDDWFIDAEIMIRAGQLGLRAAAFETDFFELAGRRSFVNLKAVAEFVVNLVRFRLKGGR